MENDRIVLLYWMGDPKQQVRDNARYLKVQGEHGVEMLNLAREEKCSRQNDTRYGYHVMRMLDLTFYNPNIVGSCILLQNEGDWQLAKVVRL